MASRYAAGVPTTRITAIAVAVVRRLSQRASRAPGSPRLFSSSRGLLSTKMATTGSVRNVSAAASAAARRIGNQSERAVKARARSPPPRGRRRRPHRSARPRRWPPARAASPSSRLRPRRSPAAEASPEARSRSSASPAAFTSVTYTNPASTAPWDSFPTIPFTSGSVERTFARIAFSWSAGSRASTSRVYEPIGTDSDPIAIFTPGLGQVLDALDVRVLWAPRARTCSWRTPPACRAGRPSRARPGSFVLAAAYTSTGTPWRIWAASSSEPANDSLTLASE